MNLKRLLSATALCAFLALTRSSFANTITPDTLKLVSVGGEQAGGVYVYPYNFSIDNSSKTTALMCMNFSREITVGEQWNVSISGLALDNSVSSIDYRAEAVLFSMLGGTIDPAAIQYAAWDIFNPNVKYSAGWQSGDMSLVQSALNQAQSQSLINSGFFSQFQIYTPLTDSASQKSWTAGEPQEFIGRTAPTPEPSSMMLLGTGLLACGFFFRRFKANEVALQAASAPRVF